MKCACTWNIYDDCLIHNPKERTMTEIRTPLGGVVSVVDPDASRFSGGSMLVLAMQREGDPRRAEIYLDRDARAALIKALTEAAEQRPLTTQEKDFLRGAVKECLSNFDDVQTIYDSYARAFGEKELSKMEDKIEMEIGRLVEKATEAI